MLIMHVIFSMLHENCGYYGNGISQNVAKKYRSQDNSKSIQASLNKLCK